MNDKILHSDSDHFEGKTVVDHLKDARAKGAVAVAEIHGLELPGHVAAGADAARETTIGLLILWVLFQASLPISYIIIFSAGWLLWKIGRSAFLGWSRLERLHRLIEEERWEIEHHRAQEKQELTEMYRAKGFSGKLLEEVIDVLMADDNRLLKVMLEEELGLTLESYEHPLKQSTGAAVGVIISSLLLLLAFLINPTYGMPLVAILIIGTATGIAAKLERNRVIPAIIWCIALAFLSIGTAFFISELFK